MQPGMAPSVSAYDCEAGYWNWEEGWSRDKKDYCCLLEGRGCEETTEQTTTEPFDCEAAYANWQAAWSDDKKSWCCESANKGCPAQDVQTQYSCDGPPESFTPQQQAYCCATLRIGCMKPPTTVPFDCTAGLNKWREGWQHPNAKFSAWSGQEFKVGCEDHGQFDCDDGFEHWKVSWSLDKQAFCCDTQGRGCVVTTTERFDCKAGLDDWEVGWSHAKKLWCCETCHRPGTKVRLVVTCPNRFVVDLPLQWNKPQCRGLKKVVQSTRGAAWLDPMDQEPPAEDIKGVSLVVALSGLGQHWKRDSSKKGPVQTTAHFDNFLSHDWQTSGLLKYLSLLILFNARAAMVASICLSVLVGVLRALAILPNKIWTQLACYVFFYLVLVFWQQTRRVVLSPRIVFLDRLCIPQDDEEPPPAAYATFCGGRSTHLARKRVLMVGTKWIQRLSFGCCAFDVSYSIACLLVLWSDRYFGRLWCVFELATFLRHHGNRQSVEVLPVELSVLVFLAGAAYCMLYLVHNFSEEVGEADSNQQLFLAFRSGGMVAVVGLLTLPFYHYLGLGLMTKFRLLPTQLQSFDAREATCYCCTVGHMDPRTATPIPCDRKLILAKLKEWYGDPECIAAGLDRSKDCGYIDQFNHIVRKQLAEGFLQMLGGRQVILQYVYFMVGMNLG
eukprot:s6805_g1.t2